MALCVANTHSPQTYSSSLLGYFADGCSLLGYNVSYTLLLISGSTFSWFLGSLSMAWVRFLNTLRAQVVYSSWDYYDRCWGGACVQVYTYFTVRVATPLCVLSYVLNSAHRDLARTTGKSNSSCTIYISSFWADYLTSSIGCIRHCTGYSTSRPRNFNHL